MKDRAPSKAHSLKQRIRNELNRLIHVYVAITGLFVVVTALTISFYYKLSDLEHQRDLIAAKLSFAADNMLQQMQALGASSVLWTGMTDTVGRSIYLEPLLKQFNQLGTHQLFLLDYRGRILLAPDRAQAELLLQAAPVMRAVSDAAPSYGMRPGDSLGPELFIYTQPIFSPQLEMPVGFIVGSMDPQAPLKDLALKDAISVTLGFGEAPKQFKLVEAFLLESEKTVWLSRDGKQIPIYLHLAQAQWDSLLFVLVLLMLTSALGAWIVRRVDAWTRVFAANTTERLDQLVQSCQDILVGRTLTVSEQDYDDEIASVFTNLGKMLAQQKALTDQLRTTSLVFMTAAEAILVTDKNGRIVDVNPALSRMTGHTREGLIGQLAGPLYRVAGSDEQPLGIAQALTSQKVWQGETFFFNLDGSHIPTTTSISPIVDDKGTTIGRVAVISDVTKLQQAEEKLRFLAYHDSLTELPNFRMLNSLVEGRFGKPQGAQRSAALLFIDMDRLKALNDNYGHEIGDVVIKAIAKHLAVRLPQGSILCRRSGDEFIALLNIPEGMELATLRRDYFLDLNQLLVSTDAGLVAASVSVGVARYSVDASNFNDLMICADIALNEAKQTQRGTVVWYEPDMGEKLYRNKLIQSKLVKALAANVLQVHYQPEVDLRTGELIGLEALLRWSDPELGEIKPSEFIRIAEDVHLAEGIAIYVFNQIVKDKPKIRQHFPGVVIAFNVAPQAFRDFRLVNTITEQLEGGEDGFSGLEIEITESDIASGEQSLLKQLQMLAGVGVPVVIDDFGMGYSSLSRLSNFPISRLKIDSNFVASMQSGQQARIVEVIINMAAVLELEVTAEGVENQAQRQRLIELGCYRAQGWLYARAMPLHELLSLPAVLVPIAAEDLTALLDTVAAS